MTYINDILIRRSDCDPLGHVRTSAYLSFLHESDLGTLEVAQIPAGAECIWSAQQIVVEFLQPLMPGDRLQVSVDLHSTEGDLSRRSYEFLREGDEKPVARAAAAWHLLEKSSLRPAPFPSGLASRLNEGAGYPLPLALEMPALSPPAPEPLSLRYQVSWGDISVDYQQSYRAWVDLMIECGLRSGVRYGWTAQRSQEMDKIFVARKLWLALDEPARHGDELSITTWLADPGRSTITRQYTAQRLRDGASIACARILWVYLDLSSGRPARMPAEFMENFREHIS